MKQKVVSIGDINVANDLPFVLFGGMNVLESRDLATMLTTFCFIKSPYRV